MEERRSKRKRFHDDWKFTNRRFTYKKCSPRPKISNGDEDKEDFRVDRLIPMLFMMRREL